MKLFSTGEDKHLALKVAENLGVKISPMEIFVFPDGEKRIKLNESVVGQDTFLLKSTGIPTDSNLMELFFTIDALKRSGAKSITAVVPYLAYSRQDHVFREGEDVSLSVIIKTLETLGMSRIIALDFHSIKIPEFFSIPVIHLSALSLFAEKIKQMKEGNVVLVSPDMGGVRRIKQLSVLLENVPFVTIVKDRDLKTGRIEVSNLSGDVRGKTAIIVDDIISTGLTISKASTLLLEEGAEKVYMFATHPVFAEKAGEVLQKSEAERVFVTDTINVPNNKQFAKLEILSVAKLIAEEIKENS